MKTIIHFLAILLINSIVCLPIVAAFNKQSLRYRTWKMPSFTLIIDSRRRLSLLATKETKETKETKQPRLKKAASYSSTPMGVLSDSSSPLTTSSLGVHNISSGSSSSSSSNSSNSSNSSSSSSSSSSSTSSSSSSTSSSISSIARRPAAQRTWRVVQTRSRNSDNDIVFTVYGEPVPLSRHMLARGRMYNPSAKLQKEFSEACLEQLPITPLQGPLEATLVFFFKRPKNHYGSGRNAHILKPAVVEAGLWHSKRKGTRRHRQSRAGDDYLLPGYVLFDIPFTFIAVIISLPIP